jgi:hypothetical protein
MGQGLICQRFDLLEQEGRRIGEGSHAPQDGNHHDDYARPEWVLHHESLLYFGVGGDQWKVHMR